MEPKKWPKQEAFIIFTQRNNKYVNNFQKKETYV